MTGVGRYRFDRGGNFAAIDIGHTEIGDDDVEGLSARGRLKASMPACPPEAVTTCPSSCKVSCRDLMSSGSSSTNRMRRRRPTREPGRSSAATEDDVWEKNQSHGGAPADCAVDLEFGTVALDHAVDHGQPEPGAALAFRRIEGLEAAAARIFVHADAGVADLDQHTIRAVAVRGLRVRTVSCLPPAWRRPR